MERITDYTGYQVRDQPGAYNPWCYWHDTDADCTYIECSQYIRQYRQPLGLRMSSQFKSGLLITLGVIAALVIVGWITKLI